MAIDGIKIRIPGSSSKNGYLWYADIEEKLDDKYLETNKSTINYVVYIQNQGKRFSTNGWKKKTSVDGNPVWEEDNANITTTLVGNNDAVGIMYGSKEIEHDADGSRSIWFEAYISKASYGTYDPGWCYLNEKITLTTIPRASSVTATSGNIEENIIININRASDSFRHTLVYSFGNLSGIVFAEDIADVSYQWQLPTSLYSQIPNSQYGTGTITCITKSNGNEIGRKTCSFTAYANYSKCRPDISMTVVDTNEKAIALTGDNKKLIKFVSNPKIVLGVSGRNGASIKSSSVYCGNGQTVAGTSVTFNNTDSNYFKGNTIDTRGYSNSIEKSLEMINYIILTLNVTVFRPLQTGNEIKAFITGNYFNGSFGSKSNAINLKYRYCENGQSYSEKYTSLSPTLNNDGTYKIEVSLGTSFDYKKSYKFEFVVEDKINRVSVEKSLSRGIPIHAMFEKFFEYWGIKSFEVSEDGSTLILNGNIKISGSNKLLKDL